jgi:tetratricopeptide (TPR) repeat protein
VPLYRKTIGPEHPSTLRAISNLANLDAEAGRKDEALQLREELLNLCRKVLGSEHPETLKGMTNLASSYAVIGRTKEATELLKQVVDSYRKVYGQQHPETLRAVGQLDNLSAKSKTDSDQTIDSASKGASDESKLPPSE